MGLALTCLYFQIPLMVLIITPALEGLRREWREAAESLGATGFQYWRMLALPVLWPSLLGTLALLFANAFGPYMVWMGGNRAYEPSALAVVAFVITWACMGLIQLFTRFSKFPVARR